MTETTMPRVVQSYLAQLDAALVGVADVTAQDIRAGIAEELTDLDASTAALRIEQLGDPFFIAAEARESSAPTETPAALPGLRGAAETAATRGETTGYILGASLLVALGGMVIPVLGWVAGIVLVLASRAWGRAEKWAAVLTPFCAVALTAAILAVVGSTAASPKPAQNSDGFYAPSIEDLNPLIPAWYDTLWSSALVLILVNFAVGITLLVRALRRRPA